MCTWLWINTILVGGFNPSEKYDFVSWEYEIPNIWKNNPFMFQTTNQNAYIYIFPNIWINTPIITSIGGRKTSIAYPFELTIPDFTISPIDPAWFSCASLVMKMPME